MAGQVRVETCSSAAVAEYRRATLVAAGWQACAVQGGAEIDTYDVGDNHAPASNVNTAVAGAFIVLAIR